MLLCLIISEIPYKLSIGEKSLCKPPSDNYKYDIWKYFVVPDFSHLASWIAEVCQYTGCKHCSHSTTAGSSRYRKVKPKSDLQPILKLI